MWSKIYICKFVITWSQNHPTVTQEVVFKRRRRKREEEETDEKRRVKEKSKGKQKRYRGEK